MKSRCILAMLLGAVTGCTRVGDEKGVEAPLPPGATRTDAGPLDEALPVAPSVHICDGGTDLRLGMLLLEVPARLQRGTHVLFENGTSFLYVDGSCRYWARTDGAWAETRTGVLTPEQEARLTSDARYAEWRRWSGEWRASQGASDAAARLLYPSLTRAESVLCLNECFGEELPPGLVAAVETLHAAPRALWEAGSPLEGGVRYTVVSVPAGQSETVPSFSWSVPGVTLAEVAHAPSSEALWTYGQGRFAEGAAAAALRALRARHAETPAARNFLIPYIPVKDAEGLRYELYVRDALPF